MIDDKLQNSRLSKEVVLKKEESVKKFAVKSGIDESDLAQANTERPKHKQQSGEEFN